MDGTRTMIAGHLCSVQASDRYSAVVNLRVADSCVQLCFAKDNRPELKQRLMKNLMDAYDQRVHRS